MFDTVLFKEFDTQIEKRKAEQKVPVSSGDEKKMVNNDKFRIKPLNLILYGPPGTGKTYNTVTLAVAIANDGQNGQKQESVNDLLHNKQPQEKREDTVKEYKRLEKDGRIKFVTFHQSYGYEEFIRGIRPHTTENGQIEYEVQDGVFKEFCDEAKKTENSNRNYVFIIDEINRGNVSKIFGELITLIEEDKRLGNDQATTCVLPYRKNGDETPFGVPNNVYILGTMNTADRSLVQLDVALRRRFAFHEMMPRYDLLEKITVKGVEIGKMLEAINNKITVLLDREHQIGHSYFMKLNNSSSIDDLQEIFDRHILPLLQEYFFDDYDAVKKILGEKFVESKSIKINKEEKTFYSVKSSQSADDYIHIYSANEQDNA